MKKEKRNVIVSRFEVLADDFRFDDSKSICTVTVNTLNKTISFANESGDFPTLYIILMAMSVNKYWLQIVDSFERPADMSQYFLLTHWISFEVSDFYLCHEVEDGLPVIDKQLVKCFDDGSISLCTLTPLDYMNLWDYDGRFMCSTPKSRLKELREEYAFKYIK